MRVTTQRAFDNLGNGRGPHIQAGPCCMKDSGGQRSWCNMYSSHAAAWEAIACVNVAKAAAVDRCLANVRSALSRKVPPDALAREAVLAKAMTAIKIHDWVELARSWKNVGNDPKILSQTVSAASKESVTYALQDPLIREYVAENLKDIGMVVGRVEENFERAYDNLLSEFPGAASQNLQAMAVPQTPSPSAMRPALDRDGCLKAINVKVASCMDSEFKRPNRNSSDFGYIAQCQSKFATETAACPR